MIIVFSTQFQAAGQICEFIKKNSNHSIIRASNINTIGVLVRHNVPDLVFLFAPDEASAAIELQNYLREKYSSIIVRILPANHDGFLLDNIWEKVVSLALKQYESRKNKSTDHTTGEAQ